MKFSKEELAAGRRLVCLGLEEDLGPPFTSGSRDVTTQSVLSRSLQKEGQAFFVARAGGVLSGLEAAEMVFQNLENQPVHFQPLLEDGHKINKGDKLARVWGALDAILTGERTALNLLQHLSGVATLTRRFVDAVAGLPVQILDTRKTLPGYRLLQKYAVRCGGGQNHRLGLFDAILIKDNHIASLGGWQKMTAPLFNEIRQSSSGPLEIEVETLEQLQKILPWGPDIVLLDNMSTTQLNQAVVLRNQLARQVLLEASGGIQLENVRLVAETGVNRISIGALTHSAPALDIALDYA